MTNFHNNESLHIVNLSEDRWHIVSRNDLTNGKKQKALAVPANWPQCMLERYWNRLTPQSRHFGQKLTSYRAWLRCKVQLKVLRETAGKCHDDQQKGQNQFGCGRTLWAMKTTYECLLMYGAHNREIKCSHSNHKFGTSKLLIRVASLKRPQWPTTYWYVGLNGWSWLRCRAPGILLEVVTTTRIKRCGRRNVQSSLAPMSWHSIRFEFQKKNIGYNYSLWLCLVPQMSCKQTPALGQKSTLQMYAELYTCHHRYQSISG